MQRFSEMRVPLEEQRVPTFKMFPFIRVSEDELPVAICCCICHDWLSPNLCSVSELNRSGY